MAARLVSKDWKGPVFGTCHICNEDGPLVFCGFCTHWFCLDCVDKLKLRTRAWIEHMLKGSSLDCCGPKAAVA